MAYIGLRNPLIGKLNSDGTYEAPQALGKAISMEITANFAEASLYGNDGTAEYVKEFTNADVTLGTSTIPIELMEPMFGHKIETDKTGVTYNKDDKNNYVGIGIIAPEIVDDVNYYSAIFILKVKFSDPSDSWETKGESISFKTPSISGKATANDAGVWKETGKFDTEAAALAWINEKFGVTAAAAKAAVNKESK